MIDLKIVRIPDTPMKLLFKGANVYGCFWYGDHFYRRDSFTEEMKSLADKYHAATFLQRLEKEDV